jgi:hypothetical protein
VRDRAIDDHSRDLRFQFPDGLAHVIAYPLHLGRRCQ